MAEQFVGEHISVLLKSPPNTQLRGIVGGVQDQQLTLRDVVALPGGAFYPVYVLESSQIADLQILSKPTPQAPVQPTRSYAAAVSPQPFVDPAILSMTHSIEPQQISPATTVLPSIPSIVQSVEKIDIREPKPGSLPKPKTTAQTPLKGPSRPLLVPAGDNYTGKRSRRGRRHDSSAQLSGDDDMGPNYVNGSPQKPSRAGKKMVVQQLVDPDDFSRSQGTIDKAAKRKDKKVKGKYDVSNEWAGEDTTDIQGLGDFDFAANLSKFDKRTVFNEIRAGDTTADEDRLVSHNRLPRPGTGGGKNYHHTENVLGGDNRSRPNAVRTSTWKQDDSSSSETERRFGSGHSRNSSRDAASHPIAVTRNGSSRKGSAVTATHLSATRRPHYGSSTKGSGSQRASPEPSRSSKASLRLPSNRLCPAVSLLQMLDIEQNAERDFSITEELVTENAGRNIAQMALSMLSSGSRSATIVILTANNKSGPSALATARQLLSRGLRVLVCVLGLERTEELHPALTKQIAILRAVGGQLSRWSDVSATVKALESPPELVIDALLGLHVPFSELRRDDQAAAFEMIKFSNASSAKKLAVDIPTGIDVLNGTVAVVDGIELVITPDVVLAIGAPKSGLLAAVEQGTGRDWVLFVTDVGLPAAAWRSSSGKRARKGIEFGREWIVKLRYSVE